VNSKIIPAIYVHQQQFWVANIDAVPQSRQAAKDGTKTNNVASVVAWEQRFCQKFFFGLRQVGEQPPMTLALLQAFQ